MDAEQIKNLKDEINEVLDHVISDIMKTNKEDATAFKVGDIIRLKDSTPKLDDCDVAVVTWVSKRSTYIYVMRSDGSCGMEEDPKNWYKVGRINWISDTIRHIHDILEDY